MRNRRANQNRREWALRAPGRLSSTRRHRSNAPERLASMARHATCSTACSTTCLAARKPKPKPARASVRRHPTRSAARILRRDGRSALGHRQMQRRRFAQQRAQRKASRTALQTQRREERMEPGANAVDGFRIAPLLAQCAGTRGVVTQCAHHMTARGTRRFECGAGKTGAQKSMHGFTSGQCVARRDARQ